MYSLRSQTMEREFLRGCGRAFSPPTSRQSPPVQASVWPCARALSSSKRAPSTSKLKPGRELHSEFGFHWLINVQAVKLPDIRFDREGMSGLRRSVFPTTLQPFCKLLECHAAQVEIRCQTAFLCCQYAIPDVSKCIHGVCIRIH